MIVLQSGKVGITLMTISCILFISGCKYIPYLDRYNFLPKEIIETGVICDDSKLPKNQLAPDILYSKMNNCIHDNEYNKAIKLYLLAGSYTNYDYNRVKTQYAKNQHRKLLSNSLLTLTDTQKGTFWNEVKKTMSNERENYCNEVLNIGPPLYEPSYMYIDTQNKIEDSFNGLNWKKSVNEYLECSFTD